MLAREAMIVQKAEIAGTHLPLVERIVGLMQEHGSCTHPQAYEVWHAYLTGSNIGLASAIDGLVAKQGSLTHDDVNRLYDRHLLQIGLIEHLERTSSSVAVELDNAVELMNLVSGNAHRYGNSLHSITSRLDETSAWAQNQHIVKALLESTRAVLDENRRLEARLTDTRQEIQMLRETIEAVRIEAFTDPLTRLSNRKHFETSLTAAIEKSRQDRVPLSLIMIDIDHFKRFNDTYGHPTGDRVLMLVADTMGKDLPENAIAARYGGEEFAIILPELDDEKARRVAEQIRSRVQAKELVKRSTGASLGRVSVSLGIAGYKWADSAASFVERCDFCLLVAKRMGRNRCVHESELEDGDRRSTS